MSSQTDTQAYLENRCRQLEHALQLAERRLRFSQKEQRRQEELSSARDSMLKRLNMDYQNLMEKQEVLSRELLLSHERLQAMLDYSPFPIFNMTMEGQILYSNPAFLAFNKSMRGGTEHVLDVFPPDTAAEIMAMRILVADSGVPAERELSFDKEGVWTTFAITMFRVRHAAEDTIALCAICRDLTESRQIMAENIRSGQLASLGELVASVAHEINNPINGIINYSQMLIDAGQEDPEHILSRIIHEGDRIASITRSMLQYAHHGEGLREPCSMADIIHHALELTRLGILKSGIHLAVDIPNDLPKVMACPGEIQQVVINLITNARKAVLESNRPDGTISIFADRKFSAANGTVRICVEDDGRGLQDDQSTKVFEPFYSDFSTGVNTGLGLTISQRIVDIHNGSLAVSPLAGKTRFLLDLPKA